MTLQTRLSIVVAAAAAVAVLAVSSAAYLATSRELRSQVDQSLLDRAALARFPGGGIEDWFFESERMGGPNMISQLITTRGIVVSLRSEDISLPIEDVDVDVVRGESGRVVRNVSVDDTRLRMATIPIPNIGALQIARTLTETDSILSALRMRLLLIGAGVVALAAAIGGAVARRYLQPVAELTTAAEHVAETQELSGRIEVTSSDEVGRLAVSFNAMLDALEESRRQQRQLVHDAGHELRTPLTALRTNLEVLGRSGDMPDDEREQLLADVRFELEQLSSLVAEVVDLATHAEAPEEESTDLRFDELVQRVAERTRRRTDRPIEVSAQPAVVHGSETMLERAVGNLLDNAHKWSPNGRPIEVTVAGGRVAVRDHGPGVAREDKPRVFDRFYRSTAARSMPGSGLGLAIVRQIVSNHSGRVFVADAPGGGAIVGFEIPHTDS